ncbi:AraC family transcriptional regulator [Streptomyces sp. NPDC058457]|uniref:helix-turn-helix transcriptional regulator n=1 Tax=Streptomyces sp. NPDC058457 TaxID=3346507 RepID=UPI00366857BB
MSDHLEAAAHSVPQLSAGTLAQVGRRVLEDTVPPHTHDFFEIAVVLQGHGRHQSLDGTTRLCRGDVMLVPPGVPHSADGCRSLAVFHCLFRSSLLEHELSWARTDAVLGRLLLDEATAQQRTRALHVRVREPDLQAATEHLGEMAALHGRCAAEHRADVVGRLSLLLGILARAANDTGAEPEAVPAHPAVTDALRILDAELTREWTLTDLADALSLTPSYLSRLFKGHTGMPPMAYLARRRAEAAADLLARTDATVADIAQRVGWSDQNYFARRFKAHFGRSPSEYRQDLRMPTQRSSRLRAHHAN